jgi:hypothetical protein
MAQNLGLRSSSQAYVGIVTVPSQPRTLSTCLASCPRLEVAMLTTLQNNSPNLANFVTV